MSDWRSDIKIRCISFFAWLIAALICRTCRFHVTGFDRIQKMADAGDGAILALWHGRTLTPIYYCRGMGIWAIVSVSRDGEIQSQVINRFGYQSIRGSSSGESVKAAISAVRRLREGGILAITPDGPRGPAGEVQQGVVFLAEQSRCPVIPVGVGIRPRKLFASWDRYALPLPFAKCRIIFGEPIYLADQEITDAEEHLKAAINDVQSEAQSLVKEV